MTLSSQNVRILCLECMQMSAYLIFNVCTCKYKKVIIINELGKYLINSYITKMFWNRMFCRLTEKLQLVKTSQPHLDKVKIAFVFLFSGKIDSLSSRVCLNAVSSAWSKLSAGALIIRWVSFPHAPRLCVALPLHCSFHVNESPVFSCYSRGKKEVCNF